MDKKKMQPVAPGQSWSDFDSMLHGGHLEGKPRELQVSGFYRMETFPRPGVKEVALVMTLVDPETGEEPYPPLPLNAGRRKLLCLASSSNEISDCIGMRVRISPTGEDKKGIQLEVLGMGEKRPAKAPQPRPGAAMRQATNVPDNGPVIHTPAELLAAVREAGLQVETPEALVDLCEPFLGGKGMPITNNVVAYGTLFKKLTQKPKPVAEPKMPPKPEQEPLPE